MWFVPAQHTTSHCNDDEVFASHDCAHERKRREGSRGSGESINPIPSLSCINWMSNYVPTRNVL